MSGSFPGDLNADSSCCSLLWLSIARQYQSHVSLAQKNVKIQKFMYVLIYGVCMFECVWTHVVCRGTCVQVEVRVEIRYLHRSPPYTVKLGLLLNRKFTNSAILVSQPSCSQNFLFLPAAPGLYPASLYVITSVLTAEWQALYQMPSQVSSLLHCSFYWMHNTLKRENHNSHRYTCSLQ